MYELKICHLYPDLLNLYGDRGNITCIKKRMEWRGHKVEVDEIRVGENLKSDDYDIFFIGGGQDFDKDVVMADLKGGKGDTLVSEIEKGTVVLAISGGYQLLGKSFKDNDGKQTDLLGAIDVYTVDNKKRMVGDFCFKSDASDGSQKIIGFENHSGKTYLGEGVRPFGTIISGHGNNGEDGTEGARYKNVFASYCHGPLLPKNPKLCDLIIKTALLRKYPDATLDALDDTFEKNAYEFMENRLK